MGNQQGAYTCIHIFINQPQQAVAPFALPGGGFGGAPRPGYVPGQPKIPPGNQNARIYVGSIAFEVAVDVVKRLFESFGAIRSCTLLPDPNNPSRVRVGGVFGMLACCRRSTHRTHARTYTCGSHPTYLPPLSRTKPKQLHRGYGFIEFETEAAAQQALQTMNGFELYGRQMKVGPANPGAAMAGGGAAGAGAGGMGMGGAMGGWQQYPPQQQQWAGQQQWGQPAAGAQGAWGMQQPQAGGYGAVAGQQGAQPQQWAQWGQQAGGQQAGGQQQQQWTGY